MNALDSYALGMHYYDKQEFGYASLWIFQVIEWLKGPHKLPLPLELDRAEVFHVYAETLIKMSELPLITGSHFYWKHN